MTKPRKPGIKRRAPMLATILRACAEPTDSLSIAEQVGIGRNAVLYIMRRLHGLGLVHIGAWTEASFGRPPAARWMAGAGENAPRPVGKWRGINYVPRQLQPHTRSKVSPDMVAFAHAIRLMTEKPASADEIEAATGWAHTTVTRFICHCRRIGLIHIGDWHRTAKNCGVWARMYQMGDEADSPKPKAIPRSVVERRSAAARRQKAADLRMAHALAANAAQIHQAA